MLQFEKYQQYAGGQLSGANYDLWGIGESVAGMFNFLGTILASSMQYQSTIDTNEANRQIAAETNQANRDIAEETNAANLQITRETNELQVKESDKAYQRSTQSNQIAELVKAGYSFQQAKQIVAQSGSASSYPPASMQTAQMQAATMQPATMQVPNIDVAAIGNSAGQLAGALGNLGDDAMRLDGGSLGMLGAQKNINVVFDHMDDIDEDSLTSPRAFQQWYRNPEVQKEHDWLTKDQIFSFDKMFKHANQARAFMTQTRDLTLNFSDSHRFKGVKIENEQKQVQLCIDRLRETLTQSQVDLAAMEVELKKYDVQLAPANYNLVAQKLANEFETAKMQGDVLHKPAFRQAFISEMMNNMQYRNAFAYSNLLHEQIKTMSGQAAKDFMEQHKVMFGIYDLFDSYGMTNSSAGQIVAALTALQQDGSLNNFLKTIFPDEQFDDDYNPDDDYSPFTAKGRSNRRKKKVTDKAQREIDRESRRVAETARHHYGNGAGVNGW